ncbi:MAG TPA: DUF1292 domain-containing protein [Bacillota bacterium]|nr:DUF1292 domain-containing protein [Bacillota bacterium]
MNVAEEELNWITLVDEEGKEHRFNLINILEMDGLKYAVMVPEQQVEETEEEAFIFRLETDEDGEEVLVDIEDDEEFNRVCEMLDELEGEEEEESDPEQ